MIWNASFEGRKTGAFVLLSIVIVALFSLEVLGLALRGYTMA